MLTYIHILVKFNSLKIYLCILCKFYILTFFFVQNTILDFILIIHVHTIIRTKESTFNHQFNANEPTSIWRSRFFALLKSMIRYKKSRKETGVQKLQKYNSYFYLTLFSVFTTTRII